MNVVFSYLAPDYYLSLLIISEPLAIIIIIIIESLLTKSRPLF